MTASKPEELALAALPQVTDLGARTWVVAEEGRVAAGPDARPADDECLPATFPEEGVIAGADVTFEHLGGHRLVHANTTVFADADIAEVAAAMLADEAFVRCFVASAAAEVEVAAPTELLGPVVASVAASDAPGATASSTRAVLAAVDGDTASSISIDVGVVRAGVVVVLLWAVGPSGDAAQRCWSDLVDASRRRCAELAR